LSVLGTDGPVKTAFVFAAAAGFWRIQVGMLQSLAAHGIVADMWLAQRRCAQRRLLCRRSTLDGVQRLATHLARVAAARRFPDQLATSAELLCATRDFLTRMTASAS